MDNKEINNKRPIIPVFNKLYSGFKRKSRVKISMPKQISKKDLEVNKYFHKFFENEEYDLMKTITARNKFRAQRAKKNKSVSLNANHSLSRKINFGSLTYLAFKEGEGTNNLKNIIKTKERLLNSNNFIVRKDLHVSGINFNDYVGTNTSYVSSRTTTSHGNNYTTRSSSVVKTKSKFKELFNQNGVKPHKRIVSNINKDSIFKFESDKKVNSSITRTPKIPKLTLKNILPNLTSSGFSRNFDSSRTVNTFRVSLSKLPEEYFAKKEMQSEYKKKIYEKIEQLNTNREKNEKKLFKLVDNAKIPKKKMNKELKKDIEIIMEIKLNEKAKKFQTKNDVFEAFATNDGSTKGMHSTNASLINLAEQMNKLSDDEIMSHAEQIVDEYMKKSKNAGLMGFINFEDGTRMEINRDRDRVFEAIRNKMQKNLKKIYKLRMRVNQEQIQFDNKVNTLKEEEKNIKN